MEYTDIFGIIFLIIITSIFSKILKNRANIKSIKSIPGPRKSNGKLGNLNELQKHGSLHQFLGYLHKKYGNIATFYWLDTKVVSICHYEYFKCVKNLFDRPALIFENFKPLIGGESLQYANGVEGKDRRKVYDKSFTHKTINRFMKSMSDIIEKQLDIITKGCHDVENCDKLFLNMSIRAIVNCCVMPISNETGEQVCSQLIELYCYLWNEMEERLINGKVCDQDSDEENQFQRKRDAFMELIDSIVDKRMKLLDGTELNEEERLLIDEMILFHGDVNKPVIVSDILTITIGGFHTTGNALSWCVYYLAENKEIEEKLYRHLLDNNAFTFDFTDNDDYNKINSLNYLRAVIDETLRYSQLAPYAARVSHEPIEMGDYIIPPDTPILLATGVALMDPHVYNEPSEFKPDRFLNHKIPSFAFEPFGFAGKRQCPGIRFTYIEMSIWLIHLIKKFRFQLLNASKPDKIYGLVTHMDCELNIRFVERT